jgi:putative FmdB family regulatory protein
MAIWDYHCEDCDKRYEIMLVKSTDTAKCPECKSNENQTKLITGLARAFATDDDAPKTKNDLANYWGNGVYRPGYKMGTPHS